MLTSLPGTAMTLRTVFPSILGFDFFMFLRQLFKVFLVHVCRDHHFCTEPFRSLEGRFPLRLSMSFDSSNVATLHMEWSLHVRACSKALLPYEGDRRQEFNEAFDIFLWKFIGFVCIVDEDHELGDTVLKRSPS